MGLSLLPDGSIATFSNLSDYFSYREVFKLPIPSGRNFQRKVITNIDPNSVETVQFKRQNPDTGEIYGVSSYKLKDSENSIEVSNFGDTITIEVIGNPKTSELRGLLEIATKDVSEDVIIQGDKLDRFGFTKTIDGFIKPNDANLYVVTRNDVDSLKLGILEPINRILRQSHTALLFEDGIEEDEISNLLRYLRIHESSIRSTYEKTEALKNKVFYGMQDVVSDPIVQINLHTPIAMTDPQAAAANSTLGNEEKTFTSDNPGVKFKMQLQNMAGKEVTGIGAVSLKSFFGATFFFNQVAASIGRDIIELKQKRQQGLDTSALEQNIYEKINWIVFDSKLGTEELRSLANVYWRPIIETLDESTEFITISELHENKAARHLSGYISGNVLELKRLLEQLDRTSKLNNAADLISAIVSSATDNAKELILAKINATSKFADIYTLLLNTGMPFKEIADFMMSPIFNVVNDFITPNMFDSRTKFLKVEQVIKFVLDESSILVNSNTFDNVLLHDAENMSENTSFIMKLIYETNNNGEIISPKKMRSDSPLKSLIGDQPLSDFLLEYRNKLKARYDSNTRPVYEELRKEIYNIIATSPLAQEILLKHLENQITVKRSIERNAKYNPNDEVLEKPSYESEEISEEDEGFVTKIKEYRDITSSEMRQLYDYVEDYLIPKMRKLQGIRRNIERDIDRQIESGELRINRGDKQTLVDNLYNAQKTRLQQLIKVLPACEEQQFLGRMLGVNKGLKTDDFEEYKWVRSFETFINKRLSKSDVREPFDFLKFVSDENYRNYFIDKYEEVKAMYNPLRIVSTAQHFSSMLKLVETNRYLLEHSAAVKLERKIAKEILEHEHEKSDTVIQNSDTKTLNQQEFARLKTYVTDVITLNWFYNLDDLAIDIPEGKVSYHNGKPVTVARTLKLSTLDNLASFKHFMDSFVIPKLKQVFKDNKFLAGLIPDHRTDFRSGQPIFFYKPVVEMLNVDGTLKTTELYEGMLEGFNELYYTEVSDILGIKTKWTFGDLFFLYDLITNKNGYGNESFARFFEDVAKFGGGNTLVNKFYQYISELDNGNISIDELQYDLNDLKNRMADLPGALEKFGVSLEKDGNRVVQTNLWRVSVYGSTNWIDSIPVEQNPSDYTFGIVKGDNQRRPIQTSKHDAFKVSGLTERISVTPANKDVIEASVSRIRSLFGSKINVPIKTITTSEIKQMYESGSGEITFTDEQDYDMTIASNAFIHNGVIYVNTDHNFVDGPLHEVLHVICAAMKIHPKYRNKYYEWMERLRKENKPMIKKFEANYPNKKGSDLKEEVFVHMLGEAFRTKFNDLWGESRELMRAEITNAVIDVFNQIFLTEIDAGTNGFNMGSTDLGYMLKIANTKLFNPENAYITRTSVPVSQMLATLKNKLIIEYGDEC